MQVQCAGEAWKAKHPQDVIYTATWMGTSLRGLTQDGLIAAMNALEVTHSEVKPLKNRSVPSGQWVKKL